MPDLRINRSFNRMSVADRRLFFLSRSCRGASVSPDTSCRRGTYFFTYGLPVASSRCLAIVRKRPLASVRCSVPPGASAIRATDAAGESSASRLKHCRTARRKAKPTPTALGCCVGCATKSKQRSCRECDSPFPTHVGPENRTFPGQQSLLDFNINCKKPEKVFI